MQKTNTPEFMTVREVARYLGINEKKVYFLAKTEKIPCTRVTGKWTFPKQLIDRWIEESASGRIARSRAPVQRSFLLAAGSDDPALAILHDLYGAREQDASLFMATVGSGAGLESIRRGVADFATAHLFDPARSGAGGRSVQALLPRNAVVVELFYRELGWIVPKGNPNGIESVRDLARPKLRFINRQAGSGTRVYLDQRLAGARMSGKKIAGYDDTVCTHLEVGARVLSGRCDVGLATRTTAHLLGLDFVPLTRERFDIVVPQDRFFTEGMQRMLGIVGSREFRDRVGALGGYDVAESGRIVGTV
jgi:putative molybdopterin biosynthesis protein